MSDLIININKKTRQVELTHNYLGNDHENLQENLVFTFDEFVDGQARLEYIINDIKNYIILNKEDTKYTIPVKNVLTIYQEETVGKIEFQLVVTGGTNEEEIPVFKSNIFYLRCRPSINAVNEAPEGYDLWIEQANVILNEMDNIDIDITTVGEDTKVVITRKDGTEKESIVTSNYDDTEIRGLISDKVDKVEGKGLSTNDFTNIYKDKIDTAIQPNDNITQLTNNAGFITNTVNNLTNYYKKTETYTQAEVNSLIGTVSSLNVEIVETLPTQDISTSTIYLVPKTPSTNDNYDEYIYVSNNWEHIGSTDIDLSGYQTKIDSSHKLLSDLVDSTNQTNKFVTSTEKSTWSAKYDKPSGGIPSTDMSTAVQTSLGKADTAIQDISGKLDISKVKNATSTTSGDVYDVTYINTALGNIETLLSNI